MAETLPEGTDHIIPGAGVNGAEPVSGNSPGESHRDKLRSGAADLREKLTAQGGEYRAQATDKARDYATQGKDKASGALDEVARLISDNAAQIDDKIGAQYGDYVRRAADGVSAAADHLRGKDVDELVEDARTAIRQSPALALGAAAAAGFFLARIIKSGSDALAESARAAEPPKTSTAPAPATAAAKPKKGAAKPSDDV